ncbi:MAG: hypothetical protein ACFCUV_00335 [Rivularia sp. (in: cyanobacteria)]
MRLLFGIWDFEGFGKECDRILRIFRSAIAQLNKIIAFCRMRSLLVLFGVACYSFHKIGLLL